MSKEIYRSCFENVINHPTKSFGLHWYWCGFFSKFCITAEVIITETLDSFFEFFQFILGLFRTEVPNKAAVIKFWIHKGICYCFFFFMAHKCLSSLQVAFSWLLTFLQVLEMCFSKFSLLSLSLGIWQKIPWLVLCHLYLIQIYLGLSWNLYSLIEIYLGLL